MLEPTSEKKRSILSAKDGGATPQKIILGGRFMKLANQDIRALMREKKVPVYAVGAAMGVHENTVFRRLRFELPEQDKQAFIRIINELAAQDETANN